MQLIGGFPTRPIGLKGFKEGIIKILKAKLKEQRIVVDISPMILASAWASLA